MSKLVEIDENFMKFLNKETKKEKRNKMKRDEKLTTKVSLIIKACP